MNKAVFPTSYDYAAVVKVVFITLSFAVIIDVKNNYNCKKNAQTPKFDYARSYNYDMNH